MTSTHTEPGRTKTISVVGLGYVGLPTAAAFAASKVKVIGVDVNKDVVNTVNRGEIHIVEPSLDIVVRAAVSEGYLKATTVPKPAEAFIVSVPTPLKVGKNEPDLSFIQAAAKMISPVLEAGNLVILESTSPVGTTEQMAAWLADARRDLTFPQTHGENSDIRIAHCPERVLPGRVIRELVENDRVIGGMTPLCADTATQLYKTFVQGECVVTDARTAEMVKLTENSFRDLNIAFANELSFICDEFDIDVWEVTALANRHPRVDILQAGPGVGGHCLAIDPWFIVSRAQGSARLIQTAREVNESKPKWVIEKVKSAVHAYLLANPGKNSSDVTVACYGLAFKPDIDDLRESPALEITCALAEAHAGRVLAVEPNVDALPKGVGRFELVDLSAAIKQADVHVLLVDHREFRAVSPPIGQIVDVKGTWQIRPSFRS